MTDLPTFVNEPIGELRRASVRDELTAGMAALEPRLPLKVPVWIGTGERHGDELVSTDPGNPDRVVAAGALATDAEVDEAVRTATKGFQRWSQTPAVRRAEILVKAAAWMRARRAELAALAVRECAKPWDEADADVCEAIDFLEFYARGAVALDRGKALFQVPGERNEMRYAPRGVVAVISPWNFPIAIPMGMTAAGLATGNSVVLKPAEQSPGCGLMVVRALREAGVPPDALALLPGEGETGAALVKHPGVHTIAFTGSGPVGLQIIRAAAEPSARHLKRVVAEMGGKNCVVVDSDADLDDAVPAIVTSAFVYAGQKCSAASRVLVHEAIAEELLERLGGAVELLQGDAGTLLDLMEVRRLFEPVATALAATRISEPGLTEVKRHLDAMREARDDVELLNLHDAAFHRAVIAATGNETLLTLLEGISGRTLRARIWRGLVDADASGRTLAEHEAIYEALSFRNPNLAQAAALIHVSHTEGWLRTHLASDSPGV
jgi:delta 1-pyrroline-5-carboxylate dehydrogenase